MNNSKTGILWKSCVTFYVILSMCWNRDEFIGTQQVNELYPFLLWTNKIWFTYDELTRKNIIKIVCKQYHFKQLIEKQMCWSKGGISALFEQKNFCFLTRTKRHKHYNDFFLFANYFLSTFAIVQKLISLCFELFIYNNRSTERRGRTDVDR